MRKFNKLWLVLLVSTLILQTSCTRQAIIDREEDQIEGEWYFSRVRITSFLNIDNVTSEFRDARLTFYEDYSLLYVQDNGDVLEGTWTFNIVDGGEEQSRQLILQLEDSTTGEDQLLIWDDLTVTNRRMWAQEDYNDRSQINYQLRKL